MIERLRQKDVASRLDLDVRQIRNLRKLGLPLRKDTKGDYYPWPECLHWYIGQKLEKERAQSGDKRLQQAQLREQEGKADLKQLELAEKQRELIPTTLALDTLSELCSLFRSAIQSFEGRLAAVMPGVQTPAETRQRAKPLIDASLEAVQESAVRLARTIGEGEGEDEEPDQTHEAES